MKRTGAMLLAAVLAFALAAPAAAEAPANGWTSSTWTTLIHWATAWANDLGQVFGASTTKTQSFPEIDPDGPQANPEIDPDGPQANTESDPDA